MASLASQLSIEVVRKTFPPTAERPAHTVLSNIKIDVAPRSFVVLTGPSGCGKSTLLNIVAGLDGDYEGEVRFADPNVHVGFIFQSPRLLPWRTVYENIVLALPEGDPKLAQIPDMLRQVGLENFAAQYPERLSLGMQRRAALVRGFITEPDILLMDEPFVSLDDPTAQGLREVLIRLWTRRPTTVLFVTHDRARSGDAWHAYLASCGLKCDYHSRRGCDVDAVRTRRSRTGAYRAETHFPRYVRS